jgi:hypothetical protein
MDEVEANKRIAFWKVKKKAYEKKGNKSGIARADAAITRIEAAKDRNVKPENKRPEAIVTSEHRKSYKEKEKEKGGLI